jgi:hypothetical protein
VKRPFALAAAAVAVVIVVVAVVLVLAGGDDEPGATGDTGAAGSPSGPTVVADETWCSGWDQVVVAQGTYVASPTPANATTVLDAVGALKALGVPESLDPAGYTELGAVLDDLRGSVDPSFTPSVVPSEPADVESDNAAQAPFGAWLAEYCPR